MRRPRARRRRWRRTGRRAPRLDDRGNEQQSERQGEPAGVLDAAVGGQPTRGGGSGPDLRRSRAARWRAAAAVPATAARCRVVIAGDCRMRSRLSRLDDAGLRWPGALLAHRRLSLLAAVLPAALPASPIRDERSRDCATNAVGRATAQSSRGCRLGHRRRRPTDKCHGAERCSLARSARVQGMPGRAPCSEGWSAGTRPEERAPVGRRRPPGVRRRSDRARPAVAAGGSSASRPSRPAIRRSPSPAPASACRTSGGTSAPTST